MKRFMFALIILLTQMTIGFSTVYAETLTFPISLPATINGVTYQHAYVYQNGQNKRYRYYNNDSSAINYGVTIPQNPGLYSPYNRTDIYLSQIALCSENQYSVGYCSDSDHWSAMDLSGNWSNLGGNCSASDVNNGYCFSDLDWWTVDSSLVNLQQFYKAANWSTYDPMSTPLSFPLDKDCSGVPCTPYTAPASSVMDHSMTTPYSENNTVLAFNGEIGEKTNGYNLGCYANSESTPFDMGINYVGTYATGGSYYLCYDGHPGYDYPASSGTNINAPADGTLCVATSTTQQPYPVDVWRDTAHCPYSTAGSTSWSDYHTFYIIHEGLYINGSTNDYMTVFLHNDSLESTVLSDVEQYGYATITRGQHIAEVGGYGPSGSTSYPNHMHFEVYKKNGENWDRVDPYGDGTNDILWQ